VSCGNADEHAAINSGLFLRPSASQSCLRTVDLGRNPKKNNASQVSNHDLHRHRCIFIHQRKTAGCSIITSFGITQDQPDWHLFNNGTLGNEVEAPPQDRAGLRVFTVIRNPWDRFVSGWKYLAATRDRPLMDVLKDLPAEHTGHDYRQPDPPQLDILMGRRRQICTGLCPQVRESSGGLRKTVAPSSERRMHSAPSHSNQASPV